MKQMQGTYICIHKSPIQFHIPKYLFSVCKRLSHSLVSLRTADLQPFHKLVKVEGSVLCNLLCESNAMSMLKVMYGDTEESFKCLVAYFQSSMKQIKITRGNCNLQQANCSLQCDPRIKDELLHYTFLSKRCPNI